MKTSLRIAAILIIVLVLSACQKAPAATSNPAIEDATSPAVETSSPAVSATEAQTEIPQQNNLPTVQFNGRVSIADNQPFFWLYIKPNQQEVATVDLLCDSLPYTISAGTNGILINNHCIIQTGQVTAYAVLPDGSVISIAPNSSMQINLGERNNEMILEKGEIFNNVAPQGTERTYSVLAGDILIDAIGTQFGVSVNGGTINAVVVDGQVGNRRCQKWGLEECDEWYESATEIAPYNIFSTSVGAGEWTKGEEYNPWPNGDPAMPLAAEEGRELNQVFLITSFEPGVYEDQTNVTASRETITNRILDQLQQLAMDMDDYNLDVTAMNESGDGYCTTYSANCTELEPTTTAPEENYSDGEDGGSTTSGGGATCGDNCPHQFDQSSCFTRDGHLWCFPVEGTVDDTMSAEWDITAICAYYPGETYCSWLP